MQSDEAPVWGLSNDGVSLGEKGASQDVIQDNHGLKAQVYTVAGHKGGLHSSNGGFGIKRPKFLFYH